MRLTRTSSRIEVSDTPRQISEANAVMRRSTLAARRCKDRSSARAERVFCPSCGSDTTELDALEADSPRSAELSRELISKPRVEFPLDDTYEILEAMPGRRVLSSSNFNLSS